MLSFLEPGSAATVAALVGCLVLVLVFEFSNGFHDTANAVATVIYTHSLKPVVAVVWSGLLNFAGVLLGGIAVAYALVELIPPDVLSPPDGGVAVGMLAALFISALVWNVGTWWFGIPNSSSHALIGALIGIAIENALKQKRGIGEGVDWHQVWDVLGSLLVSPILGFVGALVLFQLIKHLVHDKHLYEPPKEGKPPVWWMRAILILTCTGVSFAHGTNDGQKSIGLIMLTIIGLMPATYAINTAMTPTQLHDDAKLMDALDVWELEHAEKMKLFEAEKAKFEGTKWARLAELMVANGTQKYSSNLLQKELKKVQDALADGTWVRPEKEAVEEDGAADGEGEEDAEMDGVDGADVKDEPEDDVDDDDEMDAA